MLGQHSPSSAFVRSVADDRLAHGDRMFGIAIGSLLIGGTLVMLGLIGLRSAGVL